MINQETLCEPCLFRNLSVVATKYCKNCDERYCDNCMLGHTTQKLTRHHSLTDLEAVECGKEPACELCHHQNKKVNARFVCVDCDEHLCEDCKCFHQSQKININHRFNKVCKEKKEESTFCTQCEYTGKKVVAVNICADCRESVPLCALCGQQHTELELSRGHKLSTDFSILESRIEARSNSTQMIANVTLQLDEVNLKDDNPTKLSFPPENSSSEEKICVAKAITENNENISDRIDDQNDNNYTENLTGTGHNAVVSASGKSMSKEPFRKDENGAIIETLSIKSIPGNKNNNEMRFLGQMASMLELNAVQLSSVDKIESGELALIMEDNSSKETQISYAEAVKGRTSSEIRNDQDVEVPDVEITNKCTDLVEKGIKDVYEKTLTKNNTEINTFNDDVVETVLRESFTKFGVGESTLDETKGDFNSSDSHGDSKDVLASYQTCEPCFNQEKILPATHYCLECEERYCERCAKRHKSHRRSQSHDLFDLSFLREDKKLCDSCSYEGEDKTASYTCKECNYEHLCTDCMKYHKAQKQTKNHEVKPIPKQAICESCFFIGNEIPATSFCATCPEPELICQLCAKRHLSTRYTKDHKISTDMLAFTIRTQKNNSVHPTTNVESMEQITTRRQPGKPYVTDKVPMPNDLVLKWQDIELGENEVYHIMYKEGENGKWNPYKINTVKTSIKIEDVRPQANYVFRVRVINECTGEEGPFSPDSDKITTRESAAHGIMKRSTLIYKDPINAYALPVKEVKSARNTQAKTRKLYLGNDTSVPNERNVMMVGATGSGKSTLINAMANYILGVRWEDPFRFTLVNVENSEKERAGKQAMSQTEWITCYTIYQDVGSRMPYTINLIDTPGFGDTRGLEYDQRIVEQVRELFTAKGKRGVATIDAVCFILKAPDARLNATQMYLFEAILSLFGNDIQENICSLITFADGEKPPVLAGLEALEHKILPYDKYFTFNNSALYVNNKNPTSKTSKTFWEMGMESCEEFFNHLVNLPTKSLQLTTEVLGHREKLENTVFNLHQEVDLGLSKIDVLEQEIIIFSRYRQRIRDNKDFYYTVTENVQEIIKIEGRRQYTTNCLICNYTCHERCKYNNDDDKHKCSAMGRDGFCKQCPSYCHWTEHHNTPYIIKWVPKQKRKKYSEKQKIYEEATQMSLTQEQVLEAMTNDIEMLEYAIAEQLDSIAKYNNRLKEIALRPDPLSTVQYIDLIIDAERREKRSGFEHRIDVLEKCKRKAQYGKTVQVFKDRVELTRQTIEETISEEEIEASSSFLKQMKKVGKRIINALKI